MILIQAIIQPIRLSTVRSALQDAGYPETMVSDALGYGRQRGQTATFRGNEYRIDLLRKVILELVVDDEDLDEAIAIIRSAAKTGSQGEIGDGKIFAIPVAEAITI
ncbi:MULTISPECIES: P-II family nitrogen regulator [Pirellulaceae]|uniref:Nitrogen regulatory protein P-II 1 n=1 Tax=Aporhodopirellula rubra TaxID=980271 RepID=A0A7W5E0Z7_9BACT|nr:MULTISPECIES: P-II family nitrogen regulator [Pirellulaceae]EMI41941.1 Nitrogen regulatory protein PII [Rhodopirellula sp. SWK7]MBB3207703.1 nitrogen regulatory protein P-II 1 [Aporhodopirellula rubra]